MSSFIRGLFRAPSALPCVNSRSQLVAISGEMPDRRQARFGSPRVTATGRGSVVFTARDENWRKLKMRVEGIDAIVVDHEVDHLNGVLFLDKLDKGGKLYIPQTDENGEEKLVEVGNILPQIKAYL